MSKLRLCVHQVDYRCIDSDGEWDGTWRESYEYVIYDENNLEVDSYDGFHTEEKARIAGEERHGRLEGKR